MTIKKVNNTVNPFLWGPHDGDPPFTSHLSGKNLILIREKLTIDLEVLEIIIISCFKSLIRDYDRCEFE